MVICTCGAQYEHRSQMLGCMKLHGSFDPVHSTEMVQTNEQQRVSLTARQFELNEQSKTFEPSDNATISQETKEMRFQPGPPNSESKTSTVVFNSIESRQTGQLLQANTKFQHELQTLILQLATGSISKEQWGMKMQKIFNEFLNEVNEI